jgi:hypothetical protein
MIFPEHFQLDQKKMLEDWNTLYVKVESQFELIEKLGKMLELADEKLACPYCGAVKTTHKHCCEFVQALTEYTKWLKEAK